MRYFIFGMILALTIDWLFLVPGFLFGHCAWAGACSFEQQAQAYEANARMARQLAQEKTQ